MKKVIILVFVIFMAYNVFGFTQVIHQYIADRIDPQNACKESLMEGSTLPHLSKGWIEFPDLAPENQLCIDNAPDCTTRTIANKYRDLYIQDTNSCSSARHEGIAITMQSNAYLESNYLNIDSQCRSDFEQQIETNITTFQEDWNVSKQCQTSDSGNITLLFSNAKMEQMIIALRGYIAPANAEEVSKEEQERKQRALEQIYSILDANGDFSKNDLTAKVLSNVFDYGCFQSETRKQQYYESWKGLSYNAKQCLGTFLASDQTNAFVFGAECPQIGAQNAFYAQLALDEYLSKGFGEKKCALLSVPAYGIGNLEGTQGASMTQLTYCSYLPKSIGVACVEEFKLQDKQQDDSFENGVGMMALTAISLVGLGAFILWLTNTQGW